MCRCLFARPCPRSDSNCVGEAAERWCASAVAQACTPGCSRSTVSVGRPDLASARGWLERSQGPIGHRRLGRVASPLHWPFAICCAAEGLVCAKEACESRTVAISAPQSVIPNLKCSFHYLFPPGECPQPWFALGDGASIILRCMRSSGVRSRRPGINSSREKANRFSIVAVQALLSIDCSRNAGFDRYP
jgi:hypothetical protein